MHTVPSTEYCYAWTFRLRRVWDRGYVLERTSSFYFQVSAYRGVPERNEMVVVGNGKGGVSFYCGAQVERAMARAKITAEDWFTYPNRTAMEVRRLLGTQYRGRSA